MSFKISGVELVRRLRARIPEYETMAEHCLQHASEIRRAINDLAEAAGRSGGGMAVMPDPDQLWQARAESCRVKAVDLKWLADSICEDQMHEVTGEELVSMGLIGVTSVAVLGMLDEQSEEQ